MLRSLKTKILTRLLLILIRLDFTALLLKAATRPRRGLPRKGFLFHIVRQIIPISFKRVSFWGVKLIRICQIPSVETQF